MTAYRIIENTKMDRTELHAATCGHQSKHWPYLYVLGTTEAETPAAAKRDYEAGNEDCTIAPAPCTRTA